MEQVMSRPSIALLLIMSAALLIAIPVFNGFTGLQILPREPAKLPVSDHAVERHGVEAIDASYCSKRSDATAFFNPKTERKGYVCMIDGKWAVAITEKDGSPVTSFFKEKLKTIEQVVKYMTNQGYY